MMSAGDRKNMAIWRGCTPTGAADGRIVSSDRSGRKTEKSGGATCRRGPPFGAAPLQNRSGACGACTSDALKSAGCGGAFTCGGGPCGGRGPSWRLPCLLGLTPNTPFDSLKKTWNFGWMLESTRCTTR